MIYTLALHDAVPICCFHCFTLAVDSSRAAVSLALFPFNASSSASQCLVMVGLRGMRGDGKGEGRERGGGREKEMEEGEVERRGEEERGNNTNTLRLDHEKTTERLGSLSICLHSGPNLRL